MTKKILITSFPPFHTHPYNPSQHVFDNINRVEIESELHHLVLPVDYQKVFLEMKVKIDEIQPDIILMMGLAASRQEVTLERIAINHIDSARADNEGVILHHQKIAEDGPDGIMTKIQVDKLAENLPCSVSNSAGTYVCNLIFYQTLNYIEEQGFDILADFIHVPMTKEMDSNASIDIQQLGQIMTQIIRSLEKI